MKYFAAVVASFILIGLSSSHVIRNKTDLLSKEDGKNDDKLLLANVIYRHGERDMTGSMQLTNNGKKEMYKLGEYFHRRYSKVLGPKYSPEKVYVLSTDYDRSIMSAQSNLAGLFKPGDEEIWMDGLKWQPIPVHTLPKQMDNILRPRYGDRCPKYGVMYDYYMEKSPEALEMKSKYGKYFEYWEKKSGEKIKTIEDIFSLYKKIIAKKDIGGTLEDWEKEAIEKDGPMEHIAKTVYKIRGMPELVRIRSGFLIKEMLKRFSEKIDVKLKPDVDELKVYMYSAHSSTITTLMNGLGLEQEEIPDHGAGFLFELYESKDGEHYVQIYLRMPDNDFPKPMKIPKCGKSCSLDDFYTIYKRLIPGKFEKECKL